MKLRLAVLGAIAFASMSFTAPAQAAATASAACTSASMTADMPWANAPGWTITFTAHTTTCAAPEYMFFLEKPGRPWAAITAYGGATWAWNTTGLTGGIYWVGVWARDAGSTARYEAYWIGTYTVQITTCTSASIWTTESTWPDINPGVTIHFTGAATRCGQEIRFWLKPPSRPWRMVRDYGSIYWTWNTRGYPKGTYEVGVWARQPGSPNAYDAYNVNTYYLGDTQNCSTGLTVQATPSAPQAPGTAVQLSVHSLCGPLYEYWIKPPGRAWKIWVPYTSSPVVNWDTTGYANGTYEVGVWQKVPGWKLPYMGYAVITYSLDVGPCTAATLSPETPSPQPPGINIAFTARSTDCTAPAYEFWLQPSPSASWVLLQGYITAGPDAIYSLDTTGAPPGQIRIGVWVRQTGSATQYDAYAIQAFWLGS